MTSPPGTREFSIIVPTLDRTESLRRCLASIERAARNERLQVVVIDQGARPADGMTEGFEGLEIVYVRQARRGKSAALNEGLRHAGGAIIGFTDDDCTVPEEWIAWAAKRFASRPAASILSGGAIACPHDSRTHMVPSYVPRRAERRKGRHTTARIGPLGGNMFLRRRVFTEIGGFDECLGPGTDFPSGEDQDLTNRALRAGFEILIDPSCLVTHWGARAYADGSVERLLRAYSRGIGARTAKELRLLDPWAGYHVLRELGGEAKALARSALLRRPRPTPRAPALLFGFVAGLRAPLNRRRALFEPSGDD